MTAGEVRDWIIDYLASRPDGRPRDHWRRVVGEVRVRGEGKRGRWTISLDGALSDRVAIAQAAFVAQEEWPSIER